MALLAALAVADDPTVWATLGFAVAPDGTVTVGGTVVALGAPGTGLTGWRLAGAPSDIDGLVTAGPVTADPASAGPVTAAGDADDGPSHPNGVHAVDHVVVTTPDLARTLAALQDAGLELRRTRRAGGGEEGQPRVQAFFLLGRTVLEVVGPAEGAAAGPAHLWGVTFSVSDLDATVAYFGDRIGVARDAVQPGRRIATLRRHAGSSVPMAFMSPHARRPGAAGG
ncbi:MAG TPA: hypothetical protein VFP61_13785 [Acidimicrobiales bacterium]|nr:hypothetical protein [Acidimicrobiales bacterium]